jgi:hypothetical protein
MLVFSMTVSLEQMINQPKDHDQLLRGGDCHDWLAKEDYADGATPRQDEKMHDVNI